MLSASKEQKIELLLLLEDYSDLYLTADTASDSEVLAQSPSRSQISGFVSQNDKLPLTSSLSNDILTELTSLKVRTKGTKGKSAKVKTQWLCPVDKSSDISSGINNPKPIRDFPNVCKLMDIVNAHPATSGDMTACLISCMSSKDSKLCYHADDESIIDQYSDICTVSFGPSRSVDFIWKSNNKQGRKSKPISPELSVPAPNHSMNVMKAGCQSKILHGVPPGSKGGVRYSVSFRKLVPQTVPPLEDSPVVPTQDESSSSSNNGNPSPKKKIVLLAGDSYFERLDEEKQGKGKQTIYKVAKSGRKIYNVLDSIQTFVGSNPRLEIKKLFICVGTYDIRHCRE